MILQDIGFKTRRARKDFMSELMQCIGLCDSEEDINQLKEDYKKELETLKEDDEQNDTHDMPMHPEMMGLMAQRLEIINLRRLLCS